MYQALYRKWRPRTFDDVVGQGHITDTLKQQVAGGRTSHAYLFTGTRGTGKTTCAKILSRAVNCLNPVDGNPCNQCTACLGIENGSILDVLELDAASNNGVDQVRALRDEAVYSPAAVRKRVYIVDEVHMLSTPAFNALLKILEEPPAHLMFILATTELHKVPATIRSRCQQFAFKRILPDQIAGRLRYIAQEEGMTLTDSGAALLARLADGGLRDALSLLDQCSGGGGVVDDQVILDTLGLAGNLETAALMDQIAARRTADALETLARLYRSGKDVAAVLDELSGLARDLLVRKTAPQGGAALLTGGYDDATMRRLGEQLPPSRLLQMLRVLQDALAGMARSRNRRTDGELCLIRLCDEGLDDSFSGLAARVSRLEEQLAAGVIPAANQPPRREAPGRQPAAPPQTKPAVEDFPPWEEERPPLPPEPEEVPSLQTPTEPEETASVQTPPQSSSVPAQPVPPSSPVPGSGQDPGPAFWSSLVAGLRGKVPPSILPYLHNSTKVQGVMHNSALTLWTDSEFTRAMLNKPSVLTGVGQAAAAALGLEQVQVAVVVGQPPQLKPEAPKAQTDHTPDAMDALLSFGEKFDNIKIQ